MKRIPIGTVMKGKASQKRLGSRKIVKGNAQDIHQCHYISGGWQEDNLELRVASLRYLGASRFVCHKQHDHCTGREAVVTDEG